MDLMIDITFFKALNNITSFLNTQTPDKTNEGASDAVSNF